MSLISYFLNGIYDVTPHSHIEIGEAVQWIKDGKFKARIEDFHLHGKKEDDKIKLPYFTFAGTFSRRSNDQLLEHSGYIALDFDDVVVSLHESGYTKKEIIKLPFVYAVFLSPSYTGLKVVVRINPQKHHASFKALKQLFFDHLKLTVDDKAKDVARACFVSYDPDCFINQTCSIFNPAEETAADRTQPVHDEPGDSYAELLQRALTWAEKNAGAYAEGNRNNFAFQFACQCNRLGIPELHTQQFSLNEFADIPEKELQSTINSAYKNHLNEHGKLSRKNSRKHAKPSTAPAAAATESETAKHINQSNLPGPAPDQQADRYNETELYSSHTKEIFGGEFWTRTIIYNEDETIKEEKVSCNYVALGKFLAKNGFCRLPIKRRNAPDIFQFIRVQQNVVKQVNEQNMKDFVFDWMEEKQVPEKVVEAFIRGSKNYFNTNTLDRVPLKELKFKRDTREEAFFYYQDCFVCVTAEGVEAMDYDMLDAPIWSSQQLDRNLNYVKEPGDAVFAHFLLAAATGKDQHTTEDKPLLDKFLSICSGIGYMLHSYKDEANAKTFNIFDAKISYDKKPEGRSGKSMIFRAIERMKPTVILDGKKIDLRKPESFAKVNLDTAVIVFNDVSRNFNFEMLFHMITEEITVKKLYMDLFSIPFEDSAKIGITGNYTLKGDGGSFSARQFNVTLSDFFNPENRPDEYFGKKLYPETITTDHNGGPIHFKRHRFFFDWDEKEWNKFDSFMLQCVQQYLADGLLASEDPNYELKKLLDEVDYNFYDFMEEVERNTQISKKDLFTKFKEQFDPDFNNLSLNKWTKWLVQYCTFKNIRINPEIKPKAGEKFGRHRVDGVDYIYLEASKEKKLLHNAPANPSQQQTNAA